MSAKTALIRTIVLLAGGGVALSAAQQLRAESIKCPDIKDVWISSLPDEADHSMGRTDRIKLKVLQEMGLMAFDVSALKHRQIKSAELYLHPAGSEQQVLVPGRATHLRWVTVSTISSHWEEGQQDQSYQTDPKGHGATYNEACFGRKPWCWQGSNFSFVTSGHLNSFWSAGEIVPAENGYWKVPVDVKVVQALVAGLGDGVAVIDGSGSHIINGYVHTREAKGKEPYLLVEAQGEQTARPVPPRVVRVEPDLTHATLEHGAMRIQVRTPKDAFGFLVKLDGQPAEPWQVELPKDPGGTDVITLEDLPAGRDLKIEIAAVDAAGNLSDWTETTGKVSDKVAVPQLPKSPFEPKPGEPAKAGQDLAVWAFPEMVEVDPLTGRPLFEKTADDFRQANAIWSGADKKVRIPAARGDIAAFQLALENTGNPFDVRVKVEVTGPDDSPLPDTNIHLYRVWYVKAGAGARAEARWNAEYAIPLISPVDIARRDRFAFDPLPPAEAVLQVPPKDNNIPDQKLQALYVDIVMPQDARPGTYKGTITVKAPDGQAELPLELVVYPVTIPPELNFNPELDCYYSPGGAAGTKPFFDYHRLAHYNRCTINEVSHTQTGQAWQDMIPPLSGDGPETRVADWTEYDRRIGPLLDGSAFAGLPRDGVPVRAFYLPFFENWPMRLEGHYQMGMPPPPQGRWFLTSEDPPDSQDGNEWKEIHDLTVKPIDQAFDEAYKQGFRNVTADFVKHFDQKGWTRTYFQMYQNNKFNHRGQWWTLDEPNEYADWAALSFWARLLHQGMDFPHEAKFLYRGDISRLNWQGGFMDGQMDVAYSGGDGLKWPRLLRHIRERTGMLMSIYGSCNPVGRNNLESAAWCLKAYTVFVDGVLPWASIGRDHALFEPDDNGLLVDGGRFRLSAVPSLRVMSLRHGAQQVELLRQVVDRNKGWSRWHAAALVSQKVPLIADFRQRFSDEAAAARFGQMTGGNFMELKEGLLLMLTPN